MNKHFTSNSNHTISRLRSAARTGSLRVVIDELVTLCRETTLVRCLELTRMVPELSVETALVAVRVDE